jgi:hypothetical protein
VIESARKIISAGDDRQLAGLAGLAELASLTELEVVAGS